MYPAIAQYGKVLTQIDLSDLYGGEEVGFLRAIQDICQGGEDGLVLLSILAELSYSLCDQDVEPVQGLGLM